MLGISPAAWRDAVQTMGQGEASRVVAASLHKGDEVRFPGGYLRALTENKREGQFVNAPRGSKRWVAWQKAKREPKELL